MGVGVLPGLNFFFLLIIYICGVAELTGDHPYIEF
jgi:hypothetical protein